MFKNKKGQISIELLIILGILLLGGILVSIYYLQGVNKKNIQAAETESIIDDLYRGLGSETQIQPITGCNNGPLHCCNNQHDASHGELGVDCGGPCIATCGQGLGVHFELHLEDPENSPVNTDFGVFATTVGEIIAGSKITNISIADDIGFPSSNCSLVSPSMSPANSSYSVNIPFSDNMANFTLKCNTAGNYIITAEADLVAADGHTTQVSASVPKFIYASTNYAFDDLYISQIQQLASVSNLFPIEVSADTDYDRINITQVEITKEGAPTNNCSFFINNALKSCENGVCYNLGYLDKKENSSLFYNTFEFSCSVPGVYGFKFTGLLDTDNQEIKKETDTNYISITESNFSLEPPIAQPTPGTYPAGQEIRLILPESAPTGAIIRYTIDGSEVTPSSNQYYSPITISNDLLIKARAYHEQNQSSEAFFRYDIVGGQIYFNSLSVFSYDLAYEKNQSFPLIVYADTNSPFVNLEKVEITKGGAPTNSCSFLRPGSRPLVCENGVCENLGFLSNFDYFSGYYESFLFTCDSAGFYDFNFTGTLDFGDGTSVSHSAQITIEVLEPTYYLAPPIANPGSGIYPAGTKITLSLKDSLPGAYIRYTTDGSDVSSGSSRYSSPIVLNSNIVLKAKTFLDTQSSEQVEQNYYLPYEPYFEDLQITNMPSLSDRFIPFNIELTAQTDIPIVYISEVEILDSSDQPTSACSYRGVSGDKFLNIPCENGSCQDLGFLSDLSAANSYKNTFVFSCSEEGTYKFRFKGDLLDISHWSDQEQINIFAYTYNCVVDDPIPGEIWCLEDLDNVRLNPNRAYFLMRDLDFQNSLHYRVQSNKDIWDCEILSVSTLQNSGFNPIPLINNVFNGNNYSINNLHLNIDYGTRALFKELSSDGVVKNLTLNNFYFMNRNTGSSPDVPTWLSYSAPITSPLVAINYGLISNCHFINLNLDFNIPYIGSVLAPGCDGYGFIAGKNFGIVEKSSAFSRSDRYVIYGAPRYNVGGIVGYNHGLVINSFFDGFLSAQGNVGGIAARNSLGYIANSYVNVRNFNSVSFLGGIAGSNAAVFGNDPGEIINSYVNITDSSNFFGVSNKSAITGVHRYISDQYNLGLVSNNFFNDSLLDYLNNPVPLGSGVPLGGLPLSDEQLKNQSNFTTWDFTNIWNIDPSGTINNGYPYLRNNPPPEN